MRWHTDKKMTLIGTGMWAVGCLSDRPLQIFIASITVCNWQFRCCSLWLTWLRTSGEQKLYSFISYDRYQTNVYIHKQHSTHSGWMGCLHLCPPKALCQRLGHQSVLLCGGRETCEKEELRPVGLLEERWDLRNCLLCHSYDSFLAVKKWVASSNMYSYHDVLCCHKPQSNGINRPLLKPLKLWAKMNLSSL